MKLTAFNRLIHRRLLCSLALAVLAILRSHPILAQTAATTAVNNAPDLRDAEAQRRLNLSRRRRDEQTLENAQNNQLLTVSQEAQVADTRRRQRHRAVTMHRAITPQGRRAVRVATAPGVSQ
jgi:hypothetical protein